MEYRKDYFGFVYIWFDRRKKMFCIGSRYGSLTRTYITSTGWMARAYKKRPEDFKRRILYFLPVPDKKLLHQVEQRWLDMIDDAELSTSENVVAGRNRYYNMKKHAAGGNGSANKGKSHAPWNKGKKISYAHKISAAMTGRAMSESHREALKQAAITRWKRVSPKADPL